MSLLNLKNILKCGISSGGYWIYEDIIIYDSELKNDLTDEDALADAIKGEFTFEYELDSELYEKLIKTEDLKVVCSTTLKNPITENIRLYMTSFMKNLL